MPLVALQANNNVFVLASIKTHKRAGASTHQQGMIYYLDKARRALLSWQGEVEVQMGGRRGLA